MMIKNKARMEGPIRILHLEDVQSDADLIRRQIGKSGIDFVLKLATSKQEFELALQEFNPDIILSDHTLPSFSSTHAYKIVRDGGLTIPFILVTATVSEEFAVTMMKEGIADYLLKDRLQRLPTAILGALEKFEFETEKAEYVARMIRSENRFRTLIENNLDMVFLFDEMGGIEYNSPSVSRILGYDSSGGLKNIRDLIHPEDLPKVEIILTEVLERPGIKVDTIFRHKRMNGGTGWIEGTFTNLLQTPDIHALVANVRDITERKNSEDMIRRSRANLNAIIENSDVQVYSLNRDLRYITFNALHRTTLKSMYDLNIREGDSVMDFLTKLDPQECHEWENIYRKALDGKSLKLDKRFEGDNHQSFFSFSINPIWEKNDVIGLCCFGRDITEQKIAQDELRASEERYRNIVETAQEGIWIFDTSDKTTFTNRKLNELLEYPPEEMVNKTLFDFMDDEGRRIAEQGIDPKYAGDALAFKFRTKSNKTVWANLSNSPLIDKNENFVGVLAMVTDITYQKQYHESLIKSEASIRTILSNTHVAYVLLDTDFNIVSFNLVAAINYEKQFKKPMVQGNNVLDFFSPDRRVHLEEKYRQVLKGERIRYEIEYTDSNNFPIWYDVHLSPVVDEHQNLLGIVSAVTDITESKESELQREKMTSELLKRNQDLEQFANIVSHNLRAPVANILGICNLLSDPHFNKTEKIQAEKHIAAAAQNLDSVIMDLNTILQTEHAANQKKEPIRFSELVDAIQSSITNLMERESVTIRTNFQDIDVFESLKSYLYSIFFNLITNSIKYKKAGVNPVIEIKSRLLKNKIQLYFKDNGVGIDLQKHNDKVFGLYKRFHRALAEGKGMGLFMVKTQVEKLGGEISVSSEVDEGTEFKIEFPHP